MNNGSLCVLVCALILNVFSTHLQAQNLHNIVMNDKDRDQNCKKCIQAFREKPKEVKFSINREGNNLYFEVNDKEWFGKVFKEKGSGLAIDVVLKDRYDCQAERLQRSQIKGLLLKPVYSEKLMSGLVDAGEGLFKVNVGEVPQGLILNNELEYNILFIGNYNLCQYYITYNLDSYSWGLLDSGMYLDELTTGTKQITVDDQKYSIKRKTLKFIIPFKKNKANYSKADIKPVYDSLNLTDFDIKTLKINAYASIEGIRGRNIELQNERARSIVEALQSFQLPSISTEISASENWVEFFKDIDGTKYEYLKPFSKAEIREKISGGVSAKMEPIFKKH